MQIIVKTLLFLIFSHSAFAQHHQNISGVVLDAKTKIPLVHAAIELKAHNVRTTAREAGAFELTVPAGASDDSLHVSHVGYKSVKIKIRDLPRPVTILMEEYPMQLRAITVTSRSLDVKEIDQSLRNVRGKLYAYDTEVTNGLYNLFLSYLEENGEVELLKQCDYDLSAYDVEEKAFYERYGGPYKYRESEKDLKEKDYTEFPAVNVRHGAAVLFCRWLTEQYNMHSVKRKYSKVKFRLPTLQEWQIAALGYPKFQSWVLKENKLDVVIPDDTLSGSRKGRKATVPVDDRILYPWWTSYNYRNKPFNSSNCYMANFNSPETPGPCKWGPLPNNDGWWKMSRVTSYFPNGMGLYDMVGNVAEMIDVSGQACGGSWNDPPRESTIQSVKTYTKPEGSIGFRIFMEVVE